MQAKIEVPSEIERRLRHELRRGGVREVGGILMGECLAPGKFRVVDFTVDHGGGTVATFVRSLRTVVTALARFFHHTAHDYRRFNYLGEWHSHPSFLPTPSGRDFDSVQSIADDSNVGANFVTLLIVKLDSEGQIEGSATIFQACTLPAAATLVWMEEEKGV